MIWGLRAKMVDGERRSRIRGGCCEICGAGMEVTRAELSGGIWTDAWKGWKLECAVSTFDN